MAKSQATTRHRYGNVYFWKKCPRLDTGQAKGRPVVLIDSPEAIEAGEVLVVPVTSSSLECGEVDKDRVELPNAITTQNCTSGLSRVSWALPRLFRFAPLSELSYCGYLSGKTLSRVRENTERRMKDAIE